MTDETTTGGCLCGRVRFRCSGTPFWVSFCHCGDCRKASGGAFMVFAGYRRDKIEMLGDAPAVFESSPGVRRSFCPNCGSPLSYENDGLPGEVYVYAGVLDGAELLALSCHAWASRRLPWLTIEDDLRRYPGNSRRRS